MFSSAYRSLYWRIGIGFILCIAAVLAVQGTLLLWMLARADPDSRTNFTLRVSNDLARAVRVDPNLDIQRFIADHYPDPPRPFYAVMTNGQVFYFGDKRPSPLAVRNVIGVFKTRGLTAIPREWETPCWAAPILVDGVVAGTAVVPQNLVRSVPPMAVTAICWSSARLRRHASFAPAHRRLRNLELAARRLRRPDLRATGQRRVGRSAGLQCDGPGPGGTRRVDRRIRSDPAVPLADVSRTDALTAVRGCQEKLAADRRSVNRERSRYVSIEDSRVGGSCATCWIWRGSKTTTPLNAGCVDRGLFGRVAARRRGRGRPAGDAADRDRAARDRRGDPFRLEQALQNLAAGSANVPNVSNCAPTCAIPARDHRPDTVRDRPNISRSSSIVTRSTRRGRPIARQRPQPLDRQGDIERHSTIGDERSASRPSAIRLPAAATVTGVNNRARPCA